MCRADNRKEVVVSLVFGRWEDGFDDLASNGDWMVFLKVQLAADTCIDRWSNIMPFIYLIGLSSNDCRLWLF